MMSIVRVLAFALAVPCVALAQQSLNGQWDGTFTDTTGEQPIHFALTVVNTEVSGSIIVPNGIELSIKDGVLTGNQLNFVTVQTSGDAQIVMKWAGVVGGDNIAFTLTQPDSEVAPLDFIVTRRN